MLSERTSAYDECDLVLETTPKCSDQDQDQDRNSTAKIT